MAQSKSFAVGSDLGRQNSSRIQARLAMLSAGINEIADSPILSDEEKLDLLKAAAEVVEKTKQDVALVLAVSRGCH